MLRRAVPQWTRAQWPAWVLGSKRRELRRRAHGSSIDRLRVELQQAINVEDYRRAAEIRDELAKSEAPEGVQREGVAGSRAGLTNTSAAVTHGVQVECVSSYLPHRSSPNQDQYFFIYTITLRNIGSDVMQLQTRTWNISDAEGRKDSVRGDGVVGAKPVLGPQATFQYTSACPLRTPSGTMEGVFTFLKLSDAGVEEVDVQIAPFLLSTRFAAQGQ